MKTRTGTRDPQRLYVQLFVTTTDKGALPNKQGKPVDKEGLNFLKPYICDRMMRVPGAQLVLALHRCLAREACRLRQPRATTKLASTR